MEFMWDPLSQPLYVSKIGRNGRKPKQKDETRQKHLYTVISSHVLSQHKVLCVLLCDTMNDSTIKIKMKTMNTQNIPYTCTLYTQNSILSVR